MFMFRSVLLVAQTAAVLAVATALTAPTTVRAQTPASSVAGVTVPKNATVVSDGGLKTGLGRLLSDGAKVWQIPQKQGGPDRAEVYFWTGDSYKQGRSKFMMTMLESALTEAGYTVHNVEWWHENTPKIFDEDAYATGSLNLSYSTRPLYFHATNPKKKQSIVGVWIDQENEKRVVLALTTVGFAGAASKTVAPEVTGPDVWLVKDFKNAGKGMPTPPLPTFPKISGKPGVVRGIVLDGGGKPLANAHLVAWASAAGGFRTSHEGTTNAQGIYEIPLPVGICQIVNADCRVTFGDKEMQLPLHPADGTRDEFPSDSGHVENFVLRTSGTANENGNSYGAPVRVLTHNTPDGCIVEMTLKPVGTLADGTRGKTLVFRWKGAKAGLSGTETLIEGVPLGAYTLTACVYDGEDKLPLRAKPSYHERDEDEPPFVTSLPVKFESENTGRASLGRTNVRRFEVTLEP